MKAYKPLTVICYMFSFALLIVLPFGIEDVSDLSAKFPASVYWSIGFIILFTTFCTYLFNIFAIKKLSPTIAGSYIYLQPVFAMLIGVLISIWNPESELLSVITWPKIASTILIFLGVFLTSRTKTVTA